MLRVALRVRRADAELVLAELLELAPGGLEEVDVDAATVEYALYGAADELPELPALRAAAGDALVELGTTEVADDWAQRWREFHRPLILGRRLSVRPPWEPPAATALEVVIDPGQAFGTGAHPTTRLCLELLLDLPLQTPATPAATPATPAAATPAAVDLGCGSGVLAITAALLGHAPVLALDNDPLAIQATLENASANGAGALVGARRFDLLREPVPPAPLVLANLLGGLLLAWCGAMAGAAHRFIIASGLLEAEAPQVVAAFAANGYRERRRLIDGEWAALLMQAPDAG